MTAIHLVRIDAEKNMERFYKLDVQPTLFGEWALIDWLIETVNGQSPRATQGGVRGLAPSCRRYPSRQDVRSSHRDGFRIRG